MKPYISCGSKIFDLIVFQMRVLLVYLGIITFCNLLKATEAQRTICSQIMDFTIFDSNSPDKETCRRCSKCPPGQGLPIQCGSRVPNGSPTDCIPCETNKTYSDSYDTSHCKSCNDCGSKTVLQQCNPFQNSKCGTCRPGHFLEPLTDECKECHFCCDDVPVSDRLQECKELGMPESKQCRKTDANEKCEKEATFATGNKSTAAPSTVPTAVPSLSATRATHTDPGKPKGYFAGISCAVIITVVLLVIMVYKAVKRKRSTCTHRRSSYEGAERGNNKNCNNWRGVRITNPHAKINVWSHVWFKVWSDMWSHVWFYMRCDSHFKSHFFTP